MKNEPGHHQLKQTTPHHQQRWGHPGQQSPPVPRVVTNSTKAPQPTSPGTYIVPIVMEGNNNDRTVIINSPYGQTSPVPQGNRYVKTTVIN